jgi:xanthine/CO dehydrogenase XdhC/CoxF family maturation factor
MSIFKYLLVFCAAHSVTAATGPSSQPAPLDEDKLYRSIDGAVRARDLKGLERIYSDAGLAFKDRGSTRYIAVCTKLAESLTTWNFSDPRQYSLASEIAASALEKAGNGTPLVDRIELARRLSPKDILSAGGEKDARRRTYMVYWVALMHRMHELASQTVSEETVLNAVPPGFEGVIATSGSDGSEIADPARRAQYQTAVADMRKQAETRNEIIYAKRNIADATRSFMEFSELAYQGETGAVIQTELDTFLHKSEISADDYAKVMGIWQGQSGKE